MKLLLAATVVLPAMAAAEQSRDAMLTALAMNECAVAEDETAAVFGAQGFDGEFVRHELGEMVLDGTAFLEGGYRLRVLADYCPPVEPVPTPAQAFRTRIEESGCTITDRETRDLGVDAALMRPVVQAWVEDGNATIDGRTLTLQECE